MVSSRRRQLREHVNSASARWATFNLRLKCTQVSSCLRSLSMSYFKSSCTFGAWLGNLEQGLPYSTGTFVWSFDALSRLHNKL